MLNRLAEVVRTTWTQVVQITWFGLCTIPQRIGTSLSAVFGIAGVVAVLVAMLSIAQGFRRTMTAEGKDDHAIVLRTGADSEMMSGLTREWSQIIASAPGIARDERGALASPELFVVIDIPKRSTGTPANVPLRGVQPAAFVVHDAVRIVQGRPFEWGKNEVIVGVGAVAEFAGLELGGPMLRVEGDDWQVVGVFEAAGGISESEIWTDAAVLQAAYHRGDSFQTVYAKLESKEAFPAFRAALEGDPRLKVDAKRQSDHYASQSRLIYGLIVGLGVVIAALMGVGALFGALNTMYTAVAERTREIATLRALGFQATPVVLAILTESLVLALVGGAIGAAVALFAFDGYRAATMNWQSFSQVAFAFDVTPGLLVQGVLYATLIGLVGGFLPAIRAARMPIATALREV